MTTIIDRATSRGHADHGWLQTHHTFSFASYYNSKRMHFGALRVINDDVIAPKMGFDTHPHKNMEVISIPLSGYLRHGDSIENSDVITRGQIQLMSTGTGILHSEFNDSDTQNAELLQIWVMPRQNETTPKYENHNIAPLIKPDEISEFISPTGAISILQDAWFNWGELAANVKRNYALKGKNTGVYIFVIEGQIKIGDITLSRRDGIGITEVKNVEIEAIQNSQFLLIEVAQ